MKKAVLYSSLAALVFAGTASAGLIKNGALDKWADEGWTQFADDDGHKANGFVNPG